MIVLSHLFSLPPAYNAIITAALIFQPSKGSNQILFLTIALSLMHGRQSPFGSEPMSALEAISFIPEAEGTHNTAFNYEGMLKRVSFMRIHGTSMPGPLSRQPTPLDTSAFGFCSACLSACVAALPAPPSPCMH